MWNVNGSNQEDRYFCKTCGSKVYTLQPAQPAGKS